MLQYEWRYDISNINFHDEDKTSIEILFPNGHKSHRESAWCMRSSLDGKLAKKKTHTAFIDNFWSKITYLLKESSVHLVFDRYMEYSIKIATR